MVLNNDGLATMVTIGISRLIIGHAGKRVSSMVDRPVLTLKPMRVDSRPAIQTALLVHAATEHDKLHPVFDV